MDRRELLAASGKFGMLKRAMCVDRTVLPSGSCTESPLLVGTMLVHGLLTRRKWLLHPESAYAVLLLGRDE